MTPERLDSLLQRALETGTIPSDATPEERAELVPVLGAAGSLRLNAAQVDSEASASMPTARARFQRHIADQRAPAPATPAVVRRSGLWANVLAGRRLAFATSIAAIGLVAILALVIVQPFGTVETASALTVDDYVQVQGVVAGIDGNKVTVQSSELGNLEVALSDLTSVTDESGAREASSLKPGEPVVVGGVVTAKRAIAASALAVARPQAAPTPVANANVPVLKRFKEGLEGTVRLVSLSPDGQRARVLVVMPNSSIFVDVDRASIDALLAANPALLGARVRVGAGDGLPGAVFRLQPLNQLPDTGLSGQPQFQNIRGVVVERKALTLRVKTDRGEATVLIRAGTSISLGQSGLTLDDIRSGQALVGHEIAVAGNPDRTAPRGIVAEIIVVLPKPKGGTN
jgi:hypothetical protein